MDAACGAGAVLTASVRTIAETGSTNADLLAAVARGDAREGDWLRAERQTAGRGRQGRDWSSPDGNLFASTPIRLRPSDPPAATLALVAAVALHEALDRVAGTVPVQLKWPNDLLVAGAKLSGILLERSGDWVVAGFGVNVAHAPAVGHRATTSLHAAGAEVSAEMVFDALRGTVATWVARWRSEGFAAVRHQWLQQAHPPGTALSARLPDGSLLEGSFAGLDAAGGLRLSLASGEERVIHAADVFLL